MSELGRPGVMSKLGRPGVMSDQRTGPRAQGSSDANCVGDNSNLA